MEPTTLTILVALVAATLIGALPPIARRWGDRGLHLLIAASAGIFLGTVFLHLLPELAAAAGTDDHGHSDPLPWLAALTGFLGLFLLEKVWLRGNEGRERVDPHAVVWVSTYIGLSVHAFTAGLGLSALDLKALVLVPILWHKLTESFSLTSVLRLAGASSAKCLALIGTFALASPLGFLFGERILASGHGASELLMGLACGTFLYVAACDLLPEVFHHLERRTPRIVALLLGIASTALVPHEAGHAEEPAFLVSWLAGSWEVLHAMAPYLLLGFLVAGFVAQWLSSEWLSRWMSRDDLRSVATASVVGAPLPLCSCSVLPVAASLRKAGASKGAVSAFLVSTPETGVDSVVVTWGLLDPVMTVARPLASILSGLLTGLGVNLLVRSGKDDEPGVGQDPTALEPSACADGAGGGHTHATPEVRGGRVRGALRYAAVELFDDLAGALLLGVLLSGFIAAVLPEHALSSGVLAGSGGLLLMLLVGIPVYVCAAASTPIAAALILKGLSPGAALVFLLAGPATNLATLAVMTRYLGKRAVAVHVGVLAVVTLGLGFGLDALYRALELAPSARLGEQHSHAEEWTGLVSAVVLLGLIGATYWRRLRAQEAEACCEHDH